MTDRLLSPVAYAIILVVLMLLTVLTVGISLMPESGMAHLIAGQAIAVVKATLVVLFFMHALRSSSQTRVVIAVSVFWLVVVLMSLTFSDYLTRELIPTMYGH